MTTHRGLLRLRFINNFSRCNVRCRNVLLGLQHRNSRRVYQHRKVESKDILAKEKENKRCHYQAKSYKKAREEDLAGNFVANLPQFLKTLEPYRPTILLRLFSLSSICSFQFLHWRPVNF